MIRSLVLGTILGGLVAFLWSSVSWEVIGWHEKTLLSFQNEDDVSAVIVSHMKQSGTYLLPAGPSQEVQSPEQKKAAETIQMASALLLTWLLLQTSGLRYARRVAFLAVAGLASGVIADSPELELVGLLRRLCRRQPHRLHHHLVPGWPRHREGRQAASNLTES